MDEERKDESTRGSRGNAILTILIQGYKVDLVDVWHGNTFSRGKDHTGTVYQFRKGQIYENKNDLQPTEMVST